MVEFDLRDGEMRTGLRVPLHRGCSLRGKVLAADGTPVRALVFLVGVGALADEHLARWQGLTNEQRDRAADPSHIVRAVWSAVDGSFELRDVPTGVNLRVVARMGDTGFGVAPVPVGAPGHTIDGLELRLAPR